MLAGQLRHRVALQAATSAQDSYGEAIKTWATVKSVWGRVEDLTGRELLLAQQVQSEATVRVTIRYPSGTTLTSANRVVADGRTLEIVSVANPEGGRRELVLMCQEVA
ncbi:MAG: phage head closure protein [Planctomycetota bacterium]